MSSEPYNITGSLESREKNHNTMDNIFNKHKIILFCRANEALKTPLYVNAGESAGFAL